MLFFCEGRKLEGGLISGRVWGKSLGALQEPTSNSWVQTIYFVALFS